jgi:hypothetical protein
VQGLQIGGTSKEAVRRATGGLHAKRPETCWLATGACGSGGRVGRPFRSRADFSDGPGAGEGRQITFDRADSFTEHKEFFFETGCKTLP